MSSSVSTRGPRGRRVRGPAASASQFDGKYERYFLIDLDALGVVVRPRGRRRPTSAVDLGAAELLLAISSPVTALTRCGPASAIAPWPTTIGTKSERPGMYAVPAAQGPTIAATSGTTPDMYDLLAEQVARAGEQRARPPPGCARRPSRAARSAASASERHLAEARDLDLAGLPHRAGHHREVVGGDRAGAAVDVPQPVITPSAGASLPSSAGCEKCGPAVDADLDEGAFVDQQVEALAGGQLAALVLGFDLLEAAAEAGLGRGARGAAR